MEFVSIHAQSKAFACFDCHRLGPILTKGPCEVFFVFMADMHVGKVVDNILILIDFEITPKKFSLHCIVIRSVVQWYRLRLWMVSL